MASFNLPVLPDWRDASVAVDGRGTTLHIRLGPPGGPVLLVPLAPTTGGSGGAPASATLAPGMGSPTLGQSSPTSGCPPPEGGRKRRWRDRATQGAQTNTTTQAQPASHARYPVSGQPAPPTAPVPPELAGQLANLLAHLPTLLAAVPPPAGAPGPAQPVLPDQIPLASAGAPLSPPPLVNPPWQQQPSVAQHEGAAAPESLSLPEEAGTASMGWRGRGRGRGGRGQSTPPTLGRASGRVGGRAGGRITSAPGHGGRGRGRHISAPNTSALPLSPGDTPPVVAAPGPSPPAAAHDTTALPGAGPPAL